MKRLTTLIVLLSAPTASFSNRLPEADRAVAATSSGVLWRYPADLASRDLYYGPGGRQRQPPSTFTFLKEDLNGTNPKIVARDGEGVEWGYEAHSHSLSLGY